MILFKTLILFLLGLSSGSFINCLVYRLNHGLSFFWGRSFCPQCRHQLAWADNLPLFSFLLLRGHCRYCRRPIGLYYPLVELAAGGLTLLIFHYQFSFFNLILAYLLLAILVSDWLYQTIPDHLVYFGLPWAGFLAWQEAQLINGLAAGFLAAFFFGFLHFLTKGRGMGLGDVKLAGLLGLLLGLKNSMLAFYLAFLTGAFWGVILILLKRKRFGQQIAFGPFLVAGTIVAWFWGDALWLKISALLL